MRTHEEIYQLLAPMFDDLWDADDYPQRRPLLAHYSTVGTVERIIASNEIWLSNPLFMNDVEEIRFGILEGFEKINQNASLKKLEGRLYESLMYHINTLHEDFINEGALDLYILCFTDHTPGDTDGRLSMWRAYGGGGDGAALVFDTSKLDGHGDSPLILAKVHYGSNEARLDWLERKIEGFAQLISTSNFNETEMWNVAHLLYNRLKLFAIFTKHSGFEEEKEWRLVYYKEKDYEEKLKDDFSYAIGPRGIEPKLKLKIKTIGELDRTEVSLEKLLNMIILGPVSTSSTLTQATFKKMLGLLKRDELRDRVFSSSIPFRKA